MLNKSELKVFLEEKVELYNNSRFVDTDPIMIPHQFTTKEDIEISAFLTAAISWGRREQIIKNGRKLIQLMDNAPYDFIQNSRPSDHIPFRSFVHRTFNGVDCEFFLLSLQNIYHGHKGLEKVFTGAYELKKDIWPALMTFRRTFFEITSPQRTGKHIADVSKGSSGKRLNMFLRWMVRNDKKGVDFGIWKGISKSHLKIPLDVHSANVARKLGLLTRKCNDWAAVEDLTGALQEFDPEDPVKYDFALFGLGVFENF